MTGRLSAALVSAVILIPAAAHAQDRLKAMPGYDQYTKMQCQYQGIVKSGAIALAGGGGRGGGGGGGRGGGACGAAPAPAASLPVAWSPDDKSVDYSWEGKRQRISTFATKMIAEVSAADMAAAPAPAPAGGRAGRGAGGRGAGGGRGGRGATPPVSRRCSGCRASPVEGLQGERHAAA